MKGDHFWIQGEPKHPVYMVADVFVTEEHFEQEQKRAEMMFKSNYKNVKLVKCEGCPDCKGIVNPGPLD